KAELISYPSPPSQDDEQRMLSLKAPTQSAMRPSPGIRSRTQPCADSLGTIVLRRPAKSLRRQQGSPNHARLPLLMRAYIQVSSQWSSIGCRPCCQLVIYFRVGQLGYRDFIGHEGLYRKNAPSWCETPQRGIVVN